MVERSVTPQENLYRCYFEWFLILLGLVLIILTLGPVISSDGAVRFNSLLTLYSGNIPQDKYSLLQPLLSLLIAYPAKYLPISMEGAVACSNMLFFIVGNIAIWQIIRKDYGSATARRFLIVVASTSMFPHHLQYYFGEVLTAILLGYGLLSYYRYRKVSIVAIALGVVNTPALLPALFAAAVAQALLTKGDRDYYLFFSFLIAIFVVVLETMLKFGSIFNTPYASVHDAGFQTVLPYSGLPGFSYPLFFGLLSILFSFGKGLVFYVPAVFVGLCDRVSTMLNARKTAPWRAATVFAIAAIIVYSQWWAWYGGNFWGPRFFLFLSIPASFIIVILIQEKALCSYKWLLFKTLVVIFSMYVSLNGYVFGQNGLDVCWANNYQQEFLCWYVPEFSALWRPFVIGFEYSGKFYFGGWQIVSILYLVSIMWIKGRKCDWQ